MELAPPPPLFWEYVKNWYENKEMRIEIEVIYYATFKKTMLRAWNLSLN